MILKPIVSKKISVVMVCLSFFACSSPSIKSETLSPEILAQQSWISEYNAGIAASRISQKKGCELLTELKAKKAPSSEFTAILNLRQLQNCKVTEFYLNSVEKWLHKNAIFYGLRNTTSNPEAFVLYYSAWQNLDGLDRQEMEFLERFSLSQKALTQAKKKKRKDLEDKIRDQMPVFYFLDKKKIPDDKMMEVAYGLRMTRNFNSAKKVYSDLAKKHISDLSELRKLKDKISTLQKLSKVYELRRYVYRVEENKLEGIKDYKKNIDTLRKLFNQNNKNSDFAGELVSNSVQLARDYWTEGELKTARGILDSLVKLNPNTSQMDQVYWVLGRMKEQEKKFEEAVDLFKKAIAVNKDKNFALKLHWLVAWNLRSLGKSDESIAHFEELSKLAEKEQQEVTKFKSLYWLAQGYKTKNDMKKYKSLLEEISEDNFFGYYGRLSALELEQEDLFQTHKSSSNPEDVSTNKNIILVIDAFKKMDEQNILLSYLQDQWRSLTRLQRSSFSRKKEFAYYYHISEHYKFNQQFMEIFSYSDKKDLFEDHPYLFFPYPYEDLMKFHTAKMNVPKELVYSLMRQESLFDRKARSPADAFGLLQLLPRVAKMHQEEAGVKFSNPEDLYEPEVIIPLGVAHLARLLNVFNNSLMLTAAGYNAGTIPVKNWLKIRSVENVVEFIENISYAETETYAKLVFRNLSFYILFDNAISAKDRISFLKKYFEINKDTLAKKDSSFKSRNIKNYSKQEKAIKKIKEEAVTVDLKSNKRDFVSPISKENKPSIIKPNFSQDQHLFKDKSLNK